MTSPSSNRIYRVPSPHGIPPTSLSKRREIINQLGDFSRVLDYIVSTREQSSAASSPYSTLSTVQSSYPPPTIHVRAPSPETGPQNSNITDRLSRDRSGSSSGGRRSAVTQPRATKNKTQSITRAPEPEPLLTGSDGASASDPSEGSLSLSPFSKPTSGSSILSEQLSSHDEDVEQTTHQDVESAVSGSTSLTIADSSSCGLYVVSRQRRLGRVTPGQESTLTDSDASQSSAETDYVSRPKRVSAAFSSLRIGSKLSAEQKFARLARRLQTEYARDLNLLLKDSTIKSRHVHVFVDMSNIIIGFYNAVKVARGLDKGARILSPPFCFKNFSELIERSRNVKRKEVCGSSSYKGRMPDYLRDAQSLDYNINILERITLPTSPLPHSRKKLYRRTIYSETSGEEEDSNPSRATFLQRREQGVDELLQLKMAQSVLDEDQPGIMVLATGDANMAEFSDGFLCAVQRALKRGWIVELVSWKCALSSLWNERNFREEWGDRFRILELDPYYQDLLGN